MLLNNSSSLQKEDEEEVAKKAVCVHALCVSAGVILFLRNIEKEKTNERTKVKHKPLYASIFQDKDDDGA